MGVTNLFYYFALFIGLMTLIIGVCAVIQPKKMSTKFGITADTVTLPYVISTGIRDVFMGLTVLTLFYLQQWKALGAVHLFIAIVAISDFRVVQKHGDKKTSYVHLLGAFAVVIYGVWLLLLT